MLSELPSRVARRYTQTNTAPPDRVFPLLCPVRERDWADGWQCQMIYSESGVAEQDCIFTTTHVGLSETTWIVTLYDPEHYHIEFVNVMPGIRAMKIAIYLSESADHTTRADITYICTSLGQAGLAFMLHHFTEAQFKQMMLEWEEGLNHYLETGEMLKFHTA